MVLVDTQPLSLRRSERWESLTGVAFALLFFVGQDLLVIGAPGENSSTAKIRTFYADKGSYHEVVIGKLLVMLSVIFLLWFVGLLTSRLRLAEGDPARFARTAFAGGIACAILVGTQAVFGTAVASSVTFAKRFRESGVDPQLVRLLDTTAYSLLILALFGAAILVAATSIAARRSSIWPPWLTASGLVLAIILIPGATVASLDVVLVALWTAVVSAVLAFGLLEPRGTPRV